MLKNLFLSLLLFLIVDVQIIASEVTINSGWDFIQNNALTIADLDTVTNWKSVNIPHTWNREDPFDEMRGYKQGIGWYQKKLWIPSVDLSNIFLKFEGVNQVAEIFINGSKAGTHMGGYTAFILDISQFVRFDQENQIVARVDNRTVSDVAPLSADFTFFGGIYRDVWLIRKSDVYFELTDLSACGVYLSTPQVSAEKATLNIRARINTTDLINKPFKVIARVYNPENKLVKYKVLHTGRMVGARIEVDENLSIHQPALWSVDQPALYKVNLSIEEARTGSLLDQVMINTGFRWVSMDENRTFYLNGKPLKLIGVNRHQDFPGLGNALTNPLHVSDMERIKEMGSNFIRLAHYPQDQAVLNACDRLGLLVWEEIPVVNYITVSKGFTSSSINMMKEMIRQHFNHPSVIMWGLMNEVLLQLDAGLKQNSHLSRTEYLQAVQQLAIDLNQVAKLEDTARWTTIAHHLNEALYQEAGLNELTDVVGWNIYYGWYSAESKRAGEFLDRFHQQHPSKGIIVSEYGADAVRNLHAVNPQRFDFSCEWQTALHASYFKQVSARPHVMGATAWAFADFSSEGRKDAVPGMNNKGLLNYDRSPKDSYLFYQAALSKEPYLEIGSRDWTSRAGFASEKEFLLEPVYIFSNSEEIELWLNEESLGTIRVEDFYVKAMVPFKEGRNFLKVTTKDGLHKESCFQAIVYPSNFKNLLPSQINISMNLGANFHWIDPVSSQIWIPERAYQEGSVGFVDGKQLLTWNGFRVGTDVRINGTNNEPLYQTHRDSISEFRADLPPGWYEVTMHLAEIYSSGVREKLAYNLGAEDNREVSMVANRRFKVLANNMEMFTVDGLKDFTAKEYRFKVRVMKTGLIIQFQALKGSPVLSALSIRGL